MAPTPLEIEEEDDKRASVRFDVKVNVAEDLPKKPRAGGCCDDDACRDHLANANFFLPPSLKSSMGKSMRSLRNSFAVEKETDGCCEGGNCNDHLANANFFLPAGVMPFKAASSRSLSVRSLSAVKSSRRLLADTINEDEDEEPISRVGRSHFTAKGICCSSEIPMVQSILVPIKGIDKVKVSPATKAIYVDHDIDVVSANDIRLKLDEGGFKSTIIKDAAVEITQRCGIPSDVTVVSVFEVKNDDGNVDVDLEEEKILARLESAFGGDGKKVVKVSVCNNSITVGYNPYYVTTSQLGKSIDSALDGGVTATVTSDGGADGLWALDAMQGGIQDTIELQETSVAWPVIVSGIFCVLSFLG